MQSLPVIQINEPCHQDWDAMSGDEQRRYCGSCEKHVLNFSEMTTAEVNDAMASADATRVCARIRRLPDGSIVTKDTRQEDRRAARGSLLTRAKQVAAVATACFLAGCSSKEPEQPIMMGAVCPGESQVTETESATGTEHQFTEMGDVIALPMEMGEACVSEDTPQEGVIEAAEMGRAIVPQNRK